MSSNYILAAMRERVTSVKPHQVLDVTMDGFSVLNHSYRRRASLATRWVGVQLEMTSRLWSDADVNEVWHQVLKDGHCSVRKLYLMCQIVCFLIEWLARSACICFLFEGCCYSVWRSEWQPCKWQWGWNVRRRGRPLHYMPRRTDIRSNNYSRL